MNRWLVTILKNGKAHKQKKRYVLYIVTLYQYFFIAECTYVMRINLQLFCNTLSRLSYSCSTISTILYVSSITYFDNTYRISCINAICSETCGYFFTRSYSLTPALITLLVISLTALASSCLSGALLQLLFWQSLCLLNTTKIPIGFGIVRTSILFLLILWQRLTIVFSIRICKMLKHHYT